MRVSEVKAQQATPAPMLWLSVRKDKGKALAGETRRPRVLGAGKVLSLERCGSSARRICAETGGNPGSYRNSPLDLISQLRQELWLSEAGGQLSEFPVPLVQAPNT